MNDRLQNERLLKPKKHNKRLVVLIIVVAILFIIIMLSKDIRLWQRKSIIDIIPSEKSEIFLCYAKDTGKFEKRTLEVKKGLSDIEKSQIIIRELKKEGAIPENTTLSDFLTNTEATIYLNLSRDVLGDKTSPAKEITKVYSMVNSFLLSLKDAKKVQILVEGQPIYTLNGTVYTYKPIEFNKYVMED